MYKTIEAIVEVKGGTLSIDGTTDKMSKSKCNVIIHTPKPVFIKYLQSDFKRDRADNVVLKIKDTMKEINSNTKSVTSIIFVSDSCNSMRLVRNKLVEEGVVKFEYGCAAHCLNNFCESVVKEMFKYLRKNLFL